MVLMQMNESFEEKNLENGMEGHRYLAIEKCTTLPTSPIITQIT